ncbi:MlaC/ttg2D family ABC transporter substrate-binding protein [Coraliomargarita akajimensis]|uniref:Toluene tolerance family protein n=1 Tax=Coraliomargarita akajimensis (strain DSM 45221 / IAM 15411 / JCM 23193 / KCTC 12865 / 04OKA010-24) TaxID=583355 RepID=D5ENN7_CORAD|nr:ABC transporter substrate-binding protein [Coraliomargarita akajimensis]ADE55513.1 toluene tolerance family protein [Coraliomargarita akajimensis DSM 45221]
MLGISSLLAKEDPAVKLQDTMSRGLDIFFGEHAAEFSAEEKRAQISELINETYDINVILRRSMGRNWKKLTEAEQAEVSRLFKLIVVKVSYKGMEGQAKPSIEWGETVWLSDKRVQVPSTVVGEDQTLTVVYSLGRLSTGWQIYDLTAEDISFVSNYRQQFDDHFRRKGGKELIEKLKGILEQDYAPNEVHL